MSNYDGQPKEGQNLKSEQREPKLRPEKLYRGITINPEELTVEKLRQTLVPGTVNSDDPTKINDGNELGVYMSTNVTMVARAYARGGMGMRRIETPKYMDRGAVANKIDLPSCGVVFEIDTHNLDIREPEITQVLQGVYNNGFIGEEWIADTVPPESVRVCKLILAEHANDANAVVVEVADNSDEALQAAIDSIKEEYGRRKIAAERFREQIEQLTERERLNQFKIDRIRRQIQGGI